MQWAGHTASGLFVDHTSDYQFIKEDTVPWLYMLQKFMYALK
jgi:hypothetical protein